MIRVREYTARKAGRTCCFSYCKRPIQPGERYRERIVVREEWLDGPYHRHLVHADCALGERGWEVTEEGPALNDDSLFYVRSRYRLDVRAGDVVLLPEGKRGRVVSGTHYVHVREEGARFEVPYHPSDIGAVVLGPPRRPRRPMPAPVEYSDLPTYRGDDGIPF